MRETSTRASSSSVSRCACQPPTPMTANAVIHARSTQPPVEKDPDSTSQTNALSAIAIDTSPALSSQSDAGARRSCETACSTIASRITSPIGYARDSQKAKASGVASSTRPSSTVNHEIANSEADSNMPSSAAPTERWERFAL